MPIEKHWQDLITLDALEKNWVTPAQLGKRRFAVYQTGDDGNEVYVSSALCSHAGAELCDGYFQGHLIECPLHQGCFDIRTGAAVSAPAVRPIKCFECCIEDGMVRVLLAL